jgi:hypothetical protein
MPKNYKVLGQVNPTATTESTAYTVPSSTNTIVSTISVCNYGSSAASYRIAIRPNAETLAMKHYIAFDTPISGNDTIALTLGLTADAADVFTVYASSASVSFNLFGSEIDV